jgi:integrase
LTDDELVRLISVAREQDAKTNDAANARYESRRAAWYLGAAFAGLRKGDLTRLRWADISFEDGTITISQGKAKRDDVIPLHPQLAEELQRIRPTMGTPRPSPSRRSSRPS